jgi:hypothetical protein
MTKRESKTTITQQQIYVVQQGMPTSTVVQSVLFLCTLECREYNLSIAPDLGFYLYKYKLVEVMDLSTFAVFPTSLLHGIVGEDRFIKWGALDFGPLGLGYSSKPKVSLNSGYPQLPLNLLYHV